MHGYDLSIDSTLQQNRQRIKNCQSLYLRSGVFNVARLICCVTPACCQIKLASCLRFQCPLLAEVRQPRLAYRLSAVEKAGATCPTSGGVLSTRGRRQRRALRQTEAQCRLV